jgi:hypothetical protein
MSLALQLAVLVARGLMSLEDLDVAPPASRELERDRMRSATDHAGQGGWPGRRSPAMRYPGAGCIQPVRNLAREWIAAHPGEWQALLRLHQVGRQPVAQPLAGLLNHRPGQAQGSAQDHSPASQTPDAKGVHFP